MNPAELERIYETLAHNIDEVGQGDSELYLAKLVLLLAHSVGDVDVVEKHIADAMHGFKSHSYQR